MALILRGQAAPKGQAGLGMAPQEGGSRAQRGERGFALIFVLALVAVIVAVLSEIIFESGIVAQSIAADRDRVNAEMAALTGAEFATLLVTIEAGIDAEVTKLTGAGAPGGMGEMIRQEVDKRKAEMKAALGGKELFQMLDGLPIGNDGLDAIGDLAKINVNALLDEQLVNAVKSIPGQFVLTTTVENSKLNLNLLNGENRAAMEDALERLFSGEREGKWLEEKGWTPQRLMTNLSDYVDKQNTDRMDNSEESVQYEKLKFTHGPKNGPFESMDEIRRVPGFHDDEIYSVFSKYFTVWPMKGEEKSTDINQAPVELLSALLTPQGQERQDAGLDQLEDMRSEAKGFSQQQQVSEFLDRNFRVNTDEKSRRIASRVLGFKSTTYRVEIEGRAGGSRRTLLLVLQKAPPKAGAQPPTGQQGPLRVLVKRFL